MNSFDKSANKDGSRTYKCYEYTSKISSNLLHLKRDGRFCDIELISGNTKIKAHRVVLAASSEYFDAMFSVGLEESLKEHVELPTVPPDILPKIIDFIYTGEVVIDKQTVQHLLIAADMLQLSELVSGCGEFLKRELHPSNCLGIYRFSEAHNCTELSKEALEHAQANWKVVAYGEELLELPLPQLITLLSSEQLKVDTESQVLYPALRWLEHDSIGRRRHCFEVLSHVRLPLIPPEVLDEAIKGVKDPSIAVALKTVRVDMKTGRGALVPLGAVPRARARRVLLVVGGSCRDKAQPPLITDNYLSSVLKYDLHNKEWEELAPMAIERIQPGVAVLGGRVYAVGGEQGSQILANGECYDPQTDKWSDIAALNEARCEFGLTTWNGQLYALGGWVGSDMGASVEAYDPFTDEWAVVGRMPEPRFGMGVVTYQGYKLHPYIIWNPHEEKYISMLEKIQNKFTRFLYLKEYGVYPFYPLMYPSLFVIGMVGYSRLSVRRDVALCKYMWCAERVHHPEILEAQRLCAPDEAVGRRRTLPTFRVPQCAIYVVGGCTHGCRHTRHLLRYCPTRRSWCALAPMHQERSQLAAVVLDHHLYAIGGNGPRRILLASVERYNFDLDSWEEVAPMREARTGMAAGAADGVLVVAGGDSESAGGGAFYCARTTLASVEVYCPRENVWRAGPPLPHSRAEAGAAML